MNPIAKPIEHFFSQIATLQGTLYHIDSALSKYSKLYLEQTETIKDKIPDFALGTNLIISDITGPTDNGWEFNYPTYGQHQVKLSEYEKEVDLLIKRETGYTLSQAYEVFSSFLKSQIRDFLKARPEFIRSFTGKKLEVASQLQKGIREVRTGKNNKELFNILKLLSPKLELSKESNNKNLNLSIWYECFSFFRHSYVHVGGKFSSRESDLVKLSEGGKEYLKHFFPYIVDNENCRFQIERKIGDNNLKLISEYAFLIFKELSIVIEEDWMILKDMKEKTMNKTIS